MLDKDMVGDWTKELIEEQQQNGELKNIRRICEEYFDVWTQQLFPLLQAQGKPCYPEIVKLLHRAGCMNATVNLLTSYFSQIRKERGVGKPKTKAVAVSAPLPAARPSEVVPTPVVVSPVAAPVVEVQPSPHQVQVGRQVAVQADEVAYPHVYAKASMTPPMDYQDMRDELERWKSEALEGWVANWTGIDEFVWQDFLERIEEFNKYNSPKWTVMGNHVKFKNEIGQQQLKEAFDLLKKKVVKQRKISP
jgi:hypothetical protein